MLALFASVLRRVFVLLSELFSAPSLGSRRCIIVNKSFFACDQPNTCLREGKKFDSISKSQQSRSCSQAGQRYFHEPLQLQELQVPLRR